MRAACRQFEAAAQLEHFGDRIGGGARKHRHRQQPGADDAGGEQREGQRPADRPQRLGGLRRGIDLGDAVACAASRPW